MAASSGAGDPPLTRRAFLGMASTAALGGLAAADPRPGELVRPAPSGSSPERKEGSGARDLLTLFLCGDVMTARGVDQILPHPGDPQLHEPYARSAKEYVRLAERENGPIPSPVDFSYPWGAALSELERVAPDVRIVNLETAVTQAADWADKSIHYRMHPANLGVLTAAELDGCVLANNHVLDFGRTGLVETLDVLEKAGLQTVGAGRDRQEAAAPAILDAGAGRRVLVFAFGSTTSGIPGEWAAGEGPGVNVLEETDVAAIADRVQAIRRPADVVVASIHWGGNWGYDLPPWQRRLAHGLIERAGVDIVYGHSSHHFKAIERHRGRPVLYGCGDFLNDYEGIGGYERFRPELVLMYFVAFDTKARRLARLRVVPLRVARLRLERASPDETRWVRRTLERECARFGGRVRPDDGGGLELEWDPCDAG